MAFKAAAALFMLDTLDLETDTALLLRNFA